MGKVANERETIPERQHGGAEVAVCVHESVEGVHVARYAAEARLFFAAAAAATTTAVAIAASATITTITTITIAVAAVASVKIDMVSMLLLLLLLLVVVLQACLFFVLFVKDEAFPQRVVDHYQPTRPHDRERRRRRR